MTSASVAGIDKMNIVQMVVDVTTIYALVQDLEQHSCNMVPTPKIEIGQFFFYLSNFTFFNRYSNKLKKP